MRRGLRRWPGVLAALLVLAVGCGAQPPPDPSSSGLRVMTWNVETGRFDPADWVGTIATWRPAVVGLQEVCAGEAVALADLLRRDHGLPYVAVPGPIRPDPVEDADPVNAELRRPCHDDAVVTYGLAVLTLLPVTAASTTLYAPDRRDEQRGYQRVTLRAPDGDPLTLYNTHLGLAGVGTAQIGELAARAGGEAGPTVVLGDLNVGEEQDGLLAPLREHFAEVDPGRRVPTFENDPARPATPAREKIDYVFVRGRESVGPPTAPWVPSSDHRPLIGTLAPPGPG